MRRLSRLAACERRFEARGYTAWDPTSAGVHHGEPERLHAGDPTAFLSWTGEALDKKNPAPPLDGSPFHPGHGAC